MVGIPMVRRTRSAWPEANGLQRDIDSFFRGVGWPAGTQDLWSPPVDVEETADELIFTAELPGLHRDDIQLELEDGVLAIQGEKKHERNANAQGLLYERRWGTFTRRFTLPRAVDPDGVTADYQNGLLTVRVPKAEEAKGRRIEIRDGGHIASGRDVSDN